MFKNSSKTVRVFCTVTSLVTVLALTGCSCSGLGKLIGGGGETTTAATQATSESGTTAATAATTATTAAPGETAATTTAPGETTSNKGNDPKISAQAKPETPSETQTGTEQTSVEQTTAAEPETTTPHTHNWLANGGSPASCTEDGSKWYICSICGDEYYDVLPATGHDWQNNGGSPPDCTTDGGKWHICSICGEEYVDVLPALGHDFEQVYHMDPLCEEYGYDVYQCKRCLTMENRNYDDYPPLGHNMNDIVGGSMGHTLCCDRCGMEFPDTFSAHDWACIPVPGEESLHHKIFCFTCGYVDGYSAHHDTNGDGDCDECGCSGPFG